MELGLSYYGKNRDRIFEKRVLWRMRVLSRKEATGNWRNLHNDKFHNLHSSTIQNRIIKPRRTKRAGNVTGMGGKRNAYKVSLQEPEGKR
jgi:hypothetical protein